MRLAVFAVAVGSVAAAAGVVVVARYKMPAANRPAEATGRYTVLVRTDWTAVAAADVVVVNIASGLVDSYWVAADIVVLAVRQFDTAAVMESSAGCSVAYYPEAEQDNYSGYYMMMNAFAAVVDG